jgi:ATP-dependent DNA helicase RecG
LWETVSAFANTDGGYIVLGVSESKGRLVISGVRNPNGAQKNFWDIHNNPQKLNAPICSNSNVQVSKVDGHSLITIWVPRAARTQRPVYIDHNPMTGTYKRNYEGDYRCTPEEVRQMLRDASDDPQDLQILEGFDLTDLDPETLKSFRQRFSSREPDHPWLALDDRELLCKLGGWRRDRSTSTEGLTLAGLLMFGRERSILDGLPHYQLDYQERFSDDPETRWTYRLTLDGRWEPNLFNFYYRVYGRLVNDLDVPFHCANKIHSAVPCHLPALQTPLPSNSCPSPYLSLPSTPVSFPQKMPQNRHSAMSPAQLSAIAKSHQSAALTSPAPPNSPDTRMETCPLATYSSSPSGESY